MMVLIGVTLGIFGTMAQYEREVISSRTRSALAELKKTKKLGSPKNLTSSARKKGVETIIRKRLKMIIGKRHECSLNTFK